MVPARLDGEARNAMVMTVAAQKVHPLKMCCVWKTARSTSCDDFNEEACNAIGELRVTNTTRKTLRPTALISGVYRRITPPIVGPALGHLPLDASSRRLLCQSIASRDKKRNLRWRADPLETGMTVNVLSPTERHCVERRLNGYDQWFGEGEKKLRRRRRRVDGRGDFSKQLQRTS